MRTKAKDFKRDRRGGINLGDGSPVRRYSLDDYPFDAGVKFGAINIMVKGFRDNATVNKRLFSKGR